MDGAEGALKPDTRVFFPLVNKKVLMFLTTELTANRKVSEGSPGSSHVGATRSPLS